MVSKKITDKTYFDKDKIKSSPRNIYYHSDNNQFIYNIADISYL